MSVTALYLDTLNEHMERMILNMCPKEVDLRFLNPTVGKKGELKDADVLIVTTYKTTKDVIAAAPKVKLIQRTGVGVDMVDVAYAREKNIPISICKGFNATSVAELAILDMLALYRHIIDLDNKGKKKEWHTMTYRHDSYEIVGKTVGVVGGGTIGKEVIKRLAAFDAETIYYDVYPMPAEDGAAALQTCDAGGTAGTIGHYHTARAASGKYPKYDRERTVREDEEKCHTCKYCAWSIG